MAGSSAPRAWRAACPNCGAPVEFASAASASAICSFCRSTLLRDGDALRRIGVSAELFDDHSPLQLGASGRYQGLAFTLVGRLQMAYAEGTWNEWHALFDGGDDGQGGAARKSGWLSEDNGAYVFAFDSPRPADAPAIDTLQAGQRVLAGGRAWDVASVVQARAQAAEGELPTPPRLDTPVTVVDLRNARGEVATLDSVAPSWSVGHSVRLAELSLQGLRDGVAEKTLASRTLACPSCGAALAPTLASTQSMACGQCHAVVDISQGVGAELAHYAQNNSGASGVEPQLALGSTGTLALGGPARRWQVVGYLERCDIAEGDDDTTFWREYLVYEREEGFAFLVDAEDGWSWVRPLTGAPEVRGDRAVWQGHEYRKLYGYGALVTWVQGEFYWRVTRDERAQVTDYHGTGSGAHKRLSREQVGQEVTWSAGEALDADAVAEAFGLSKAASAPLQRDVPALALQNSGLGGGTLQRTLVIIVIVLVAIALLSMCSDDRCDDVRSTFGASSAEYQQCVRNAGNPSSGRGGSFGGWSGGGGHK